MNAKPPFNPHLSRSLLHDGGRDLTIRPSSEVASWKRLLVIAPHPDDESLGCGGVISLARNAGAEVDVLFVSDGSQSHPNSKKFPEAGLAKLRKVEALEALRILGVDEGHAHFLNLPDSRIPHPHHENFEDAVARIREVIARVGPETVLTPWRRDVHRDHIVTTSLVDEALRLRDHPPRVLEYPLWVWDATGHEQAPTEGEVKGFRVDVSPVLGRKKAAVAAHLSQTTGLIDDDPGGFVLSESQLGRHTGPWEFFFESIEKTEDRTLSKDYFEGMYSEKEDPWDFASSEYELAKYRRTISMLSEKDYRRAFEVGCSIGVLTEMLAPRCERLIASDVSQLAVDRARRRCAGIPGVEFVVGSIPEVWPDGSFDLIVLSEVLYYLSTGDLEKSRLRVARSLAPGGEVILVHWTPQVASYPQTGDFVHEHFISQSGLEHLGSDRCETYRIDTFRNPSVS